MAEEKEIRRSTAQDINGMTAADFPRPTADGGKRATDDNGELIPREFNKTEDDEGYEAKKFAGHNPNESNTEAK